jgi:DNA-binding NarL/FixJ family response regulator
MEAIRILIADDHRLFRDGMRALLASVDGFELIGEADNGEDITRLALDLQPDVILMDLAMPGLNGIDATRQVTSVSPHIGVIVVTMHDDDEAVFSAMRAGARGYILKGATQEELLRTIDAVSRGEALFGPGIAARLMTYFFQAQLEPSSPNGVFPTLTPREREVLGLIAQGLTNIQISHSLEIGAKTVRNHITNIFSKLQVTDRTEAISRAKEAGLGRR